MMLGRRTGGWTGSACLFASSPCLDAPCTLFLPFIARKNPHHGG